MAQSEQLSLLFETVQLIIIFNQQAGVGTLQKPNSYHRDKPRKLPIILKNLAAKEAGSMLLQTNQQAWQNPQPKQWLCAKHV